VQPLGVDPGLLAKHSLDDLVLRHLEAEDGHRLLVLDRRVQGHVEDEAGVVGGDATPAGQVKVVWRVDLDAANRNAVHSVDGDHPALPAGRSRRDHALARGLARNAKEREFQGFEPDPEARPDVAAVQLGLVLGPGGLVPKSDRQLQRALGQRAAG